MIDPIAHNHSLTAVTVCWLLTPQRSDLVFCRLLLPRLHKTCIRNYRPTFYFGFQVSKGKWNTGLDVVSFRERNFYKMPKNALLRCRYRSKVQQPLSSGPSRDENGSCEPLKGCKQSTGAINSDHQP